MPSSAGKRQAAARDGLPDRQSPLAGLRDVVGEPTDPVQLDEVDLRLLALLAADARVSQRALARQMGLSPPTIGERIMRLERDGVIRGYTISIDWGALGYPMQVFLAVTAVTDQGAVLSDLHQVPEVEDIAIVAGSMDMIARVRVRDHAHLRELMLDRIWQIAGIGRTETFIAFAEMPTADFAQALITDRLSGIGVRLPPEAGK